MIREAEFDDLEGLLSLYTHLHSNAMPEINAEITALWRGILADSNHHIIVGLVSMEIVSSCVLVIVPNLTHGQRPYALIENVITHPQHRGRGYATNILGYAKRIAERRSCYKIMLMTGSKNPATWEFYQRAGYNCNDKKAFIQWL